MITDPPYYDNESYSELSDVCYVWLRPTLGFLYPEDFAGSLTPKKKECVAAAYRQGGKAKARKYYEDCMLQSLQEAYRVTKSDGMLVMVYAHKTTVGLGYFGGRSATGRLHGHRGVAPGYGEEGAGAHHGRRSAWRRAYFWWPGSGPPKWESGRTMTSSVRTLSVLFKNAWQPCGIWVSAAPTW